VSIDKVQPLKLEDPTTGGDDTDLFPTELDPLEDYVECRGVALANDTTRDDNVIISRNSSSDLTFKDLTNTTPVTLTQLLAGSELKIHATSFDVIFNPPTDEVRGSVTGLSETPLRAYGFSAIEQSVAVQSGFTYTIHVLKYNTNGFDYKVTITEDEWWPGPGNLTVRIHYMWSET
jgi:hypothetical protein